MPLKIDPVTENFAAVASGIDLREPIGAETAAVIEAAMDRYAVLVWRDQPLDEAQHMAFTNWFGPLDPGLVSVTKRGSRFGQKGFIDIANVGEDGEILARDHRSVTGSIANQFWHSDSSFLQTIAKYSLLAARVIPDDGGDTEFADLRAAYDALPDDLRAIIAGLTAEHHALYSRTLLGNEYTEAEMATFQPDRRHERRGITDAGERAYRTRHPGAVRLSPQMARRRPRYVGQPLHAAPGQAVRSDKASRPAADHDDAGRYGAGKYGG